MVATADIDKAMSQISDIELALDRKDAKIKELEEEVGRLKERIDTLHDQRCAEARQVDVLSSRLALADKVVEAARAQVSKSMSVEMALKKYDAAYRAGERGEGSA